MPPLAQNQKNAAEDHALVIGISSYPKLGRNYTPDDLEGPGNDARAVTRWLVQEAGLQCTNVTCILSDGRGSCQVTDGSFAEAYGLEDMRPNKFDIEGHIDDYATRAMMAPDYDYKIGRRLWIYIAGHGFRSPQWASEICILPANSFHHPFPRNFCVTSWVNYLSLSGAFEEIVLFMDCCSTYAHGANIEGAPQTTDKGRPQARRLYVSAPMANRSAYEAPDEQNVVGGVFTRNLLKALQGAARSTESNVLRTDDLKRHLHNLADGSGGDRENGAPQFLENDDLELIILPDRADTLHKVATGFPSGAEVELFDHAHRSLGNFVVSPEGEIEVAVGPGLYKLAHDGAHELFELRPDAGGDA
jgi:hypothetical protein